MNSEHDLEDAWAGVIWVTVILGLIPFGFGVWALWKAVG